MKKKDTNKIHIWLYSKFDSQIICSLNEKKFAANMSEKRAKEYLFSRTLMRKSLSKIFDIEPISIPLESPPGKAPKLRKGFGHISLSHNKETILIGWSENKIGVDIENKNKLIDKRIYKKVFQKEEIKLNSIFNNHIFLLGWTAKEAAIKWEEKSIFGNLEYWFWNNKNKKMINKKKQLELDLINIDFKNWLISICIKNGIANKKYNFSLNAN